MDSGVPRDKTHVGLRVSGYGTHVRSRVLRNANPNRVAKNR
jgi:hypothetical protein